jgi:hypothetical protein
MEVTHLAHDMHHIMQTLCEVSLLMFGFMAVVFIIYLLLGKI